MAVCQVLIQLEKSISLRFLNSFKSWKPISIDKGAVNNVYIILQWKKSVVKTINKTEDWKKENGAYLRWHWRQQLRGQRLVKKINIHFICEFCFDLDVCTTVYLSPKRISSSRQCSFPPPPQKKIRKSCQHTFFQNTQNLVRARQKNVQRFITHVQSYCFPY